MGQLIIVEIGGMSKALIDSSTRLTVARSIFVGFLREHTKQRRIYELQPRRRDQVYILDMVSFTNNNQSDLRPNAHGPACT